MTLKSVVVSENTVSFIRRMVFLLFCPCRIITHTHTFVLAELNVGEQSDLDDLPQQTQDQVLPALLQVFRPDVDHVAADGGRRVQGQVQVLLFNRTEPHGM